MSQYISGLDEYYPGSRTKRKTSAMESVTPAVVILSDLGDPHLYTVAGETQEFYFIGQLAKALNRSSVTLRRWESDGTIPASIYNAPSYTDDPRGRRRIYSRAQVEGIVRIAAEEGLLDPARRVNSTNFSARVRALFKDLANGKDH